MPELCSRALSLAAPGLASYGAAVLADEGQLSLDAPVREYVPGFGVSDAAGTLEITMRDLLSHRSGIGFHDYLAEDRGLTREEPVQRLPHLPAAAPQEHPIRPVTKGTAGTPARRPAIIPCSGADGW